MSRSRDQLNLMLKEIDISGKTCLDLGVQDKPTSRLTRGKPKRYVTMDVDKHWKPDIVGDLNWEAYDWDWSVVDKKDPANTLGEGSFDVVFCIETLEHCWNPIQAIKSINYLLRPGGWAYISAPLINPHHDRWDYLRFTGEWYEKVLPMMGFDTVRVRERVATNGKYFLKVFYNYEGLRVSRIRPEYGRYTFPVGYFVEARKALNKPNTKPKSRKGGGVAVKKPNR